MDNQQKTLNLSSIFQHSYLDCKTFYMYCYQQPPCLTWVDKVDTAKVLKYIKAEYGDAITGIYQNNGYDRQKRKTLYYTTVIALKDNCLVELTNNFCEILHTHKDYDMANKLIKEVSRFKCREKKKDFEINLVSRDADGLNLKTMDINKTHLELKMYYEDNFQPVHKTILDRLNSKNDKGIVLLHGLPGTGKTTYIRYLIGRLKKKVLLLSPAVTNNIMGAEFMDLLIENPNSILVIEDAENVIADRRVSNDSSVSNLLNISDGLLSDFLNVQVVCTFNHPLSMVDPALMRKGRLIARYEFGKLSTGKAQILSKHLGFDIVINEPKTIAEIANPHDKDYKSDRVEVIGFKRTLLEN